MAAAAPQPLALILGRGADDEAEPDARGDDDAALTPAESGSRSALFTCCCDKQRLTCLVFFVLFFSVEETMSLSTTTDPKLSRFAVLSLPLKSCGNEGVKVLPRIEASRSHR